MLNVFLTGAGAPGSSGTLHLLKLGASSSGIQLKVYGGDQRPHLNVYGFEEIIQLPNPTDVDYLEALNYAIRRFAIDIVIPQTTAENLLLSKFREQLEAKLLALEYESVKILNNKANLMRSFSEAGLPHPKFILTNSRTSLEEALQTLGHPTLPVVIKPTESNGMRGVRKITNWTESFDSFFREKPHGWTMTRSQLIRTLSQGDSWPEMIAMEYLEGTEYSVDIFSDADGTLVFPRERTEMRAGISTVTTLMQEPAITEVTEEFIRKYSITGLFGLQYVLTQEGPMILESNPRVQGTMVASALSGVNIVWLALKHGLGISIDDSERVATFTSGVFRRTWGGDFYFEDGRLESL